MNRVYELYCPCHFGMEAILKKEIIELGYEISRVIDGRVYFYGDAQAIALSNLWLRSADRILINVAEFEAKTFQELYEGIYNIDLSDYLEKDSKFWVTKATSVKSALFSTSDIQSIAKKAMVDKMSKIYKQTFFEETGSEYPFRISILKDIVSVGLDTTGVSLHKRGYRPNTVKAPISETLAAAMIQLTPWKYDRILIDPFCGSGTIAIEAAMMGLNIAPGLNRKFLFNKWDNIVDKSVFSEAIEEANDLKALDRKLEISAFDIDYKAVRAARENAKLAGVENYIHFQERGVSELSHRKKYGFIITNPPYGERLSELEELKIVYKELADAYKKMDSWSMYMITSWEDCINVMGIKPDKNRKLYNGMLKTYFYQFLGEKPPKKKF